MFQHAVGDGSCHLFCVLVLSKVVHKVAIRINQVHDDRVVDLQSHIELEWEWGTRIKSYQVIVVVIGRPDTVVDPVGLGHLVYLLLGTGETEKSRMELCS